mmetsp:Transcript_110994/g.353647  ORF Transcript_110994/g.353647 Transcript_110994/m.353647 type:complete len:444 (-) Transcript_110994:827-2158(-)
MQHVRVPPPHREVHGRAALLVSGPEGRDHGDRPRVHDQLVPSLVRRPQQLEGRILLLQGRRPRLLRRRQHRELLRRLLPDGEPQRRREAGVERRGALVRHRRLTLALLLLALLLLALLGPALLVLAPVLALLLLLAAALLGARRGGLGRPRLALRAGAVAASVAAAVGLGRALGNGGVVRVGVFGGLFLQRCPLLVQCWWIFQLRRRHHLAGAQPPSRSGQRQRRAPAVIRGQRVGAVVQQRAQSGAGAAEGREVERRVVPIVDVLDVGPSSQQHLDHQPVVSSHGQVQGRVACRGFVRELSAAVVQQGDGLNAAREGGREHGIVAAVVLGGEAGAPLDEQFDGLHISVPRRPEQRSPLVLVFRLQHGPPPERLRDGRPMPRLRGGQQVVVGDQDAADAIGDLQMWGGDLVAQIGLLAEQAGVGAMSDQQARQLDRVVQDRPS